MEFKLVPDEKAKVLREFFIQKFIDTTHESWDHWSNPELNENAYIRICFLNAQT